jgi:Protein of unknown function (DUF2456)
MLNLQIRRNQLSDANMLSTKLWSPRLDRCFSDLLLNGNFDFINEPSNTRLARFCSSLFRGVLFSCFMFFMFWPPSVVYAALTFGKSSMSGCCWPAIQIFKAVFAFILGCFSTAICCLVAIVESERVHANEAVG